MNKPLRLVIAGLIAATLGLPGLADDGESKPKTKPEAKAKAKADAATGAQGDRKKDGWNSLDERRRRAENDQKDRARGSGASAGATPGTPSAPSGVDTTR